MYAQVEPWFFAQVDLDSVDMVSMKYNWVRKGRFFDFTHHQVIMLEHRRSRRKVIIVHFGYRQSKIDKFIVAAIETGKHWIVIVDPPLGIILYVKVYHPRASYRHVIGIRQNLDIRILHKFTINGLFL